MKKYILFSIILFFGIINVVYGAVFYSRSPSGLNVTSPITFNVSATSFSDIDNQNQDCTGGGQGSCGAWGLNAYGDGNSDYYSSVCYSSSTLSGIFTDTFPIGNKYNFLNVLLYEDINDCQGARGTASDGVMLEGNATYVIFQIIESEINKIANRIDSINSTFYDYFLVLLNKFYRFIIGALILLVVWFFGKRILNRFN